MSFLGQIPPRTGKILVEQDMSIRYPLSCKPLVNEIPVKAVHKGSCHCGAVKFKVNLADGLIDPRRCNCSMCRRRGAVVASVPLDLLTIEKGKDVLSTYQFNTKTAKHYFFLKCGIYTHHQRRSNPGLYAINIACLDGVDPFVLKNVPVYDGETQHPSDKL